MMKPKVHPATFETLSAALSEEDCSYHCRLVIVGIVGGAVHLFGEVGEVQARVQ